MLVLDMIEILPPLEKYKYDTWRILLVKCYIDSSVHLQSCIQNVNIHHRKGVFSFRECLSSRIQRLLLGLQFLLSSLELLFSRCHLDFSLLVLNHRDVKSS
jgi:hypothetical protein